MLPVWEMYYGSSQLNKEGLISLMIIQLVLFPQLQEWAWPYSGDPTRIFNRCAPFPYQAIHSALLPSTLAITDYTLQCGLAEIGPTNPDSDMHTFGFCCLNTKIRPRRMYNDRKNYLMLIWISCNIKYDRRSMTFTNKTKHRAVKTCNFYIPTSPLAVKSLY